MQKTNSIKSDAAFSYTDPYSGLALMLLFIFPAGCAISDREITVVPGTTKYEHSQGILTMEYPSFLGEDATEQKELTPKSLQVTFGDIPVNNSEGEKEPDPEQLAALEINLLHIQIERTDETSPQEGLGEGEGSESEDNEFPFGEVVETRRGTPPTESLYTEIKMGFWIIIPTMYFITYQEIKDGVSLTAVAFFRGEERKAYEEEIKKTFESISFDPKAAKKILDEMEDIPAPAGASSQ